MINAIHLFVPGPFGGAEQVILTGLEKLKNEVKIELWIIKEKRVPQYAEYLLNEVIKRDIPYRIFEVDGIFDIKLIKKLKGSLPIDSIYHAHGLKASFYAYLSKNSSPLIITHHGDTSHTLKVKVYEAIQRFIMRRANLVLAVSNQMKLDLEAYKIKSIVVENLLSFGNIPLEIIEKKKSTSLVVIGRLSPEKGIDTLISALEGIENVKLDIIG